jgi:hypothetical protein
MRNSFLEDVTARKPAEERLRSEAALRRAPHAFELLI